MDTGISAHESTRIFTNGRESWSRSFLSVILGHPNESFETLPGEVVEVPFDEFRMVSLPNQNSTL